MDSKIVQQLLYNRNFRELSEKYMIITQVQKMHLEKIMFLNYHCFTTVLNLFWSFRLHWGDHKSYEIFLEKYGVERDEKDYHSGHVRKRISCLPMAAVVNIFWKFQMTKSAQAKKWLYIGKWPSHHNLLLFNIYHPKPVRKYNRKKIPFTWVTKTGKYFIGKIPEMGLYFISIIS